MGKQKDLCMFCGELPCVCNEQAKPKKPRKQVSPKKEQTPKLEIVQPVVTSQKKPPVRIQKHKRETATNFSEQHVDVPEPESTDDEMQAIRVLNLFGMLSKEDQNKYCTFSKQYPTVDDKMKE